MSNMYEGFVVISEEFNKKATFLPTQVHQGPLYPEELYRQQAHCHNDEGSPTPPVAVSPTPPPLYENQQVVFQERDNAEAENFLR